MDTVKGDKIMINMKPKYKEGWKVYGAYKMSYPTGVRACVYCGFVRIPVYKACKTGEQSVAFCEYCVIKRILREEENSDTGGI